MILPPIPVANYASLLAAQAVAAKIVPFVPAAFQSGGETWFDGAGVIVCDNAANWRTVWDRHIQNEGFGNQRVGNLNPPPEVDFTKAIVVAMFSGPTRNVVGYRLAAGFAMGKQATLRLAPVVDASSRSTVAVPRPWAFLVLPRSNATLSIQMPGANGVWANVAQVKPSL